MSLRPRGLVLGRRGLLALIGLGVLSGCRRQPTSAPGATSTSHAFGPARAQTADLLRPPGTPLGVVVLVHGGYWQAGYDRSLEARVADDLVARGWAVWNLDYRAVGDGGGWPNTFADAAAGADLLVEVARDSGIALDRVVTVGHSAGGTLALWLAARHRLPEGAVGESPKLRPTAAVTQAGVNDLAAGSAARLGGGAVDSVIGGSPQQVPDRYQVADPAALVPADQSRSYAAAAKAAGDAVDLAVTPGDDHFAHLDPRSGEWKVVVDWLDGLARTA